MPRNTFSLLFADHKVTQFSIWALTQVDYLKPRVDTPDAHGNHCTTIRPHLDHNIFWLSQIFNARAQQLPSIVILESLMKLSNLSKTISPQDTTQKGKNPPPGQSLCAKVLPLRQNRESKAPPPEHNVRKVDKCIYKLWHYLKLKTLWSQQIKRLSMRKLVIKIIKCFSLKT